MRGLDIGVTLDGLVFRRGTVDDAASLADVLVEGFETYREFAPRGWQPPVAPEVAVQFAQRLGRPQVWCLLAETEARIAGYVAFQPAADSRDPIDDAALAHFWMLFVRAPWWGSGLAARLHAEACAAAASRDFEAMRLFTPAGQQRARRFYERRGWTLSKPPQLDVELGMEIVEYRKLLASR